MSTTPATPLPLVRASRYQGQNSTTSDNSATNLPDELVFKVFDRRFALSLRDDYHGRPPTFESEACCRQHAKSQPAPQGFIAAFQAIDDASPGGLEACPPELFEQLIVAIMGGYFESECAAYKHLTSLQGRDIPVFYGHTTFIDGLSIPDLDPPTPGILLEFVPGTNLDKIDPGSPDLNAIINEAISITNSYGDLGVINLDVRLGNFIVKPDRSVVIIDFAQSRLRREDEDDLEWIREKWAEDEEGSIGYEARSKFKWAGKSTSPSDVFIASGCGGNVTGDCMHAHT
ncbi:hypothetical protein FRC10_001773 [Ceratobasidium sp. 414]|nr:hypothetical protein FRC10_001773 [Ceratobasidium sp. 414]